MSDSPVVHAPVSPEEKPILEKLLLIRDKLLLLKQDRSTYVKSNDILPLYEKVIEQVQHLNDVRGSDRLLQNRLDNVLDDCLQLISLFFMAVGRNNEAPAIYSVTSTITRLCEHLSEATFYMPRDLESMENTLGRMDATLEKGKDQYSPFLIARIKNRIQICDTYLKELRETLSSLSEETLPVYERLVALLRSLAAMNVRTKFSVKDVHDLRDKLLAEKKVLDDMEKDAATGHDHAGHELCSQLCERCLMFAKVIEERQGKWDERFQEPFDQLMEIRNQLDRLTMTKAWSLRETDLFMWQRKLDRIDDSRRDGNFFDAEGHAADLYTQRTLLYMIRRGYAYIYQLLISSEPVSEALLPIYNQLMTLKRCLMEVKAAGGVSSPRELYPYSMKLNSIDNMRVDGKFQVGRDIPEGQGSVNELLAECYDIAYELRTVAEDGDDQD